MAIDFDAIDEADMKIDTKPTQTFLAKHSFSAIDHHWSQKMFATASNVVEIWNHQRSEPTQTFSWGHDTVTSVKFNPVEHHILASTATDRSITLHDLRSNTAIKRLVLQMNTNALCWNPMEAFNFVAANEDHNTYTFDMRKMDVASNVHMTTSRP